MNTSGSLKKLMKWMGIALVTPILLFLVLAGLLYCPPVQNWAVQKVAAIASEKTGLDITVGHVCLEWPLDLGIDNFTVIKPASPDSLHQYPDSLHPSPSTLLQRPDTLADISHLTIDVQLWPLFHKRVVINELAIRQAKLNTNGFISDLQIQGDVGELWLRSKGIDLDQEAVEVNGARLADARLDIALSDTAAVDTTQSETLWRINADSISIYRTAVALHMPGDTLHINGYMGTAVARKADIDIGTSIYKVESFDWHDGQLGFAPYSLTDIRLGVDSIYYGPEGTRLYVRQTAIKESETGLEIKELTGGIRLDTAFNHVELPHLILRTTDSDIEAEVNTDFNVADSLNPGKMRVRLNAQLGKQDLIRLSSLSSSLPASFWRTYPNHPLSIKGSVNGNVERMEITGLDVSLPTALHLKADGYAHHVTDLGRLRSQVELQAESYSLDILSTMLPDAGFRIPNNITLGGKMTADGPRYTADLTLREGKGTVTAKAQLSTTINAKSNMPDTQDPTYNADIRVNQLDLKHFLPKDSLGLLTAEVKLDGHGTNFLKKSSRLDANVILNHLHYGQWNLTDMTGSATLKDGRATGMVTGHNPLFDGTIGIDAALDPKIIEATITPDLAMVDLHRMRIADSTFTIGMKGSVELSSDLKQSHRVKGLLTNIHIKGIRGTYYPDNFGLFVKTDPDTTYARMQSGDLILKFDAPGGYERLISQTTILMDSIAKQFDDKRIDQPAIKQLLPTIRLYLTSGRNNPVANMLRIRNIDFKNVFVDLTTSAETGINGQAYVHSLNYDSTRLDTITLNLQQKGDRLTYNGKVRNNRKNPQFVFNALFDGHVHQHGALIGVRYYDNRDRLGVRLGATAQMETGGIRLKLMPERPTIGYKEFNLNPDNYIFLGTDKRIAADINLMADDKTGLKIYSLDSPTPTDSADVADVANSQSPASNIQDITVSLNRFNLEEFTSVLPYMPRMAGLLNGDFHIIQDKNQGISVASDLSIHEMVYEGSPIGNLSTELTYLLREDNSHAIEARLMLDDEEFGLLSGSYYAASASQKEKTKQDARVDATFTMTRLPLNIVNGFVTDQIIGLDGYCEGDITIKGTLKEPDVNGEIYLDSAYLISVPYGVKMRFDNDPVRIVGSHLLLENHGLYAYNDEPLNMQADINFSNTERITMDMRMRAQNLLLINAKQEARSVAFGKAYVNFFARMQGPIDKLQMRGRLDVLSSTDLTYMLLDSPLSTDNRLDELVKFTDFNDTTLVITSQRPTPSGVDMDLTISVSQGAHFVCDLNADQTNYIDLMGGGNLRMHYGGAQGLTLTGRYTLTNGEMKYSMPVIPLKTFSIQDGSYVEFTGEPTNPRLNITATERVKATVSDGGTQTRSVTFDCGVVITKTLSDMGLQFIISAPEDNSVNTELQAMSAEERGKLAVTMLTTGMYLADGNTSAFSMNSTLSSFLQSEINNIAGSALKTLDLQVGLDNSTDASGNSHTDYSFKFSKRLFDNRLKIQLGGKVSSGANEQLGQKQSFFDNVTMEYRLDQNAQKNVKLYYQQNVYDWLDGYTGLYGGGFVWRKKMDTLLDVFKIFSNDKPNTIPLPRNGSMNAMRPDSATTGRPLRTDSIKAQ